MVSFHKVQIDNDRKKFLKGGIVNFFQIFI
jgi:hypothetical protein